MPYIHNDKVARLIKAEYELPDIQNIISLLNQHGTLAFSTLDNVFPAAIVSDNNEYTGYAAVWVRDNIYVAYCHYILGEVETALKCVRCLRQYFSKHQHRFEKIINGEVDPDNVMQRPHVRFNGEDLTEIDRDWQHAQNDALGYFLWFYCQLIGDCVLQPSSEELEILTLLPLYFEAIAYWQDEDSGHWEEDRKVSASSIGVVVASLGGFRKLFIEYDSISDYCRSKNQLVTLELLDNLILKGNDALKAILPAECIQPEQARRYDAALLFLIYPLNVLDDVTSDKPSGQGVSPTLSERPTASLARASRLCRLTTTGDASASRASQRIIEDVANNLQGKYGISRYLNDSFWCRNYTDLPENIRTSISTEREQWLQEQGRGLKEGEEAQWCIFDPILSAIFGIKFQKTQQIEYLEKQTFYLNRSLGQVTAADSKVGGFKCPELYYLNQDKYVPNDATPLLWTQANLRIALTIMEQSLSLKERS